MKSVLMIALLAVLLLGVFTVWSRGTIMSASPTTSVQMAPTRVPLPRGPVAPNIVSDTWLNSPPLAPSDLRGKVVLVDFWTFDCINCRNTIPYLEDWYEKYHAQGLVIVGVHSPEFDYEHDATNVKQAIQDLKIPYPVALDNDFKTWNSYRVYAWPTWFILDKQGVIRFSHIGEGAYAESERTIVQLLSE